MKSIAFFFVLISFSLSAKLAPWEKNSKDILLESYPLKIKNGYVSSMWGLISEPSVDISKNKLLDTGKFIVDDHNFTSPYFKSGSLKGRILYWKGKRERPLYIVIPGSFSNISTPQTKRYAHTLLHMGYNVIMFPNPLSIDYLKNKPTHPMGDVFIEAKAISEALGLWLEKVESKSVFISSINIVGTSYGAFISALITGGKREWSKKLNKVFLISPPRYLMKSMLLLEQRVVESKNFLSLSKYSKVLHTYYLAFKVYWGGAQGGNLNDNDLKKIQEISVVRGFQKLFLESLSYADSVLKKNIYSKIKNAGDPKKELKSMSHLRFSDYASTHLFQVKKKLESGEEDILHWINQKEGANARVRILTTENDWINKPYSWPKNQGILVLPTGGHFGFRGGHWFDRFMREFF